MIDIRYPPKVSDVSGNFSKKNASLKSTEHLSIPVNSPKKMWANFTPKTRLGLVKESPYTKCPKSSGLGIKKANLPRMM